MSEPPPLTVSATRAAGVHLRRCVRHTQREAAARCVSCGAFYCRECVVDHGGQLWCAVCLGKRSSGGAAMKRRWLRMRRGATLGAAVLAAWLTFYLFGYLLLKLPADLHERETWETPRAGEDP